MTDPCSVEPLPYGWIVKQSSRFPDHVYYFNTITGQSSWELPEIPKNNQHINTTNNNKKPSKIDQILDIADAAFTQNLKKNSPKCREKIPLVFPHLTKSLVPNQQQGVGKDKADSDSCKTAMPHSESTYTGKAMLHSSPLRSLSLVVKEEGKGRKRKLEENKSDVDFNEEVASCELNDSVCSEADLQTYRTSPDNELPLQTPIVRPFMSVPNLPPLPKISTPKRMSRKRVVKAWIDESRHFTNSSLTRSQRPVDFDEGHVTTFAGNSKIILEAVASSLSSVCDRVVESVDSEHVQVNHDDEMQIQ